MITKEDMEKLENMISCANHYSWYKKTGAHIKFETLEELVDLSKKGLSKDNQVLTLDKSPASVIVKAKAKWVDEYGLKLAQEASNIKHYHYIDDKCTPACKIADQAKESLDNYLKE